MSIAKVNSEIYLCSFLLLIFAMTFMYPLLLVVVLCAASVSLLLPFKRTLALLLFLLPSLQAFSNTPYVSFSLATLIFIIAFGRYLLTEIAHTHYSKLGLLLTFSVLAYEWLHVTINPIVVSPQTVRWSIMFVFVSLLLFDKKRYLNFHEIRTAFLLGLLCSTGFGLLNEYFDPGMIGQMNHSERFSGAAGDPNNFGLYCLLVALFYLPVTPKQQVPMQDLMIIGGVLLIGTLTVSRTFFLVSFVSLSLYSLLYYFNILERFAFRIVQLFCILFFVFAFFQLFNFIDLELQIFERMEGDNLSDMTGSRSDIFVEYVRQFSKMPLDFVLFGAGVNGYYVTYNTFFAKSFIFDQFVGPHNTFLEIFLSFGLFGSMLFITYVVVAFRTGKMRQNLSKVNAIAFVPVLVFCLYCLTLQDLGKYSSYFLLLIIIFSVYREKENE